MTLRVRVKFRAWKITLGVVEESVDLREHLSAAAIKALQAIGERTLIDRNGVLARLEK